MLAFVPADRPRVSAPIDGVFAAIQEPARVTLVTLPMAEPFGVIETRGQIGWLQVRRESRLLVASGSSMRLVDARAARVVAERSFAAPVRLLACTGGHALVASDERLLVVDDKLVAHEVRGVPVPAAAAAVGDVFVIAVEDTLREIDPIDAEWKRTWPISATRFGGTARSLWYVRDAAPERISVLRLVALDQPEAHVFPEPLVTVVDHPRIDLVAGIGASGRVYLVDLSRTLPPRVLDTGSVVRAESCALIVDAGLVVAETQRPTQFVPFQIPTWRNELVAWVRSGVVERYPIVPAILALANELGLDVALVPAITLCYGAALCGARGVPAPALDEILGGRWPDEVRGDGRLAKTGLLVFADGWISLAPAYRAELDRLT